MFKAGTLITVISLTLAVHTSHAQMLPQHQHHSYQPLSDTGEKETMAEVSLDYVELRGNDGGEIEGDFSYGDDQNKFVAEVDYERGGGETEKNELWALYSRAISAKWNFLLGIRHDFQLETTSRNWIAVGVTGETPYSFEMDAVFFYGKSGSTAFRLEGEYELKLTQKWILAPRIELNFFGQNDETQGSGSGLSELEIGLRLMYEITKKFSPYIGVHYEREIGNAADFAREEGEDVDSTVWVLGFRAWF
ncbi:copper resistance protein B [Microbulbifer sp. OS29]|uniref:Copper resistance protein B n=1 Tax=Microbulbifer okhotskensis TaxID=2926617 RepID=A0A9X2EPS6_9GAMM|nr:copper resistance protein B [Microbulbifer okhotskensis]MCO1335559.1 copper resistance protein B [Microbulbifer okhotskensis]